MQPKIPAEAMWELIRRKPGLYLGGCSITALYYTVNGYQWALATHRIENDHTFHLPSDFHDWVAYRLRFFEPTSGWKNMLLKACENEESAFRRFFELLDEHNTRNARVFALATCEKESVSKSGVEATSHSVELLTYTSDPGFFASSNQLTERWCQGYHPVFNRTDWTNLQMLGSAEKLTCRRFEILDPEVVERLEAEAAEYADGKRPFRD